MEIEYVEGEKWQNDLFNRFLYCDLTETVIRKSGTQYFRKDVHCLPYSAWTTNSLPQYVLLISAVFENIYTDCSMVLFSSVHYSKVLSKEFKYVSLQKKPPSFKAFIF